MASQGPNLPSTSANDSAVGTESWGSIANIKIEDGATATASATPGLSLVTRYAKVTAFGFSIPSGATIDGIVVEVKRRASHNSGTTYVKDTTVKLVKAGTVVGSNNADTVTNWPTTLTFVTYGGSSDLWGTTWTDTDINDATFGFVISATMTEGAKVFSSARIDVIKITVYYTTGGGGGASTNPILYIGN